MEIKPPYSHTFCAAGSNFLVSSLPYAHPPSSLTCFCPPLPIHLPLHPDHCFSIWKMYREGLSMSSCRIYSSHGCIASLILVLLLYPPAARSQSVNQLGGKHESNHRFTPSMVIIIVMLIVAFILMAFCSVYLRLCSRDIRGGRSTLRRNLTRARRLLRRGLDPSIIDSFPTFQYSDVKGHKLGGEALECAVCLNEFEDEETLRLLPKCNHVFHQECIGSWLVSHATCPVCRSDLLATASDSTDPTADTPDPAAVEETGDAVPLHHVSVQVCGDQHEDLHRDRAKDKKVDKAIPVQNPVIRSKSTRQPFKFPRSHTTGHSILPPGESRDKFTLRLPEHVRREIVEGKLVRSGSRAAFAAGGRSGSSGSGRGRFQWRFSRAAKSDRWAFLAAPGFLARTVSVRSQKGGDDEQLGSQKGPMSTPFDCLGVGGSPPAGAESDTLRSSIPVFTVSTQ